MIDSIFVAVGGFFGAMSRYGISVWAGRRPTSLLPAGTLTVNLAGALLLGILAGTHLGGIPSLLLGTGFMGSFTTFSTFKLENVQLGLKKEWKALSVYLLISYAIGLLMAAAGFWIGQSLKR